MDSKNNNLEWVRLCFEAKYLLEVFLSNHSDLRAYMSKLKEVLKVFGR